MSDKFHVSPLLTNVFAANFGLSVVFGEARLMKGSTRKGQFGVTSDCELEVLTSVSYGKNCRLAIKDGRAAKICFHGKYS